ncbi:MAG: non-ribosomal peptide synthetase, partial [Candidatus Acidiferrales bacterium]
MPSGPDYEWNRTEVEYPRNKTIASLFEEQVVRTPDAIAIESAGQRLTYRQLDVRTNQLAHYLQAAGIAPDTLAGVAIDRSNDMLIAMLSILKAGGAYLPLDPHYPSARISMVLEDSEIPVLLTTERNRGNLPAGSARSISLDGESKAIASQSTSPVISATTPGDLAYVIYTSGSTGKPKGVMIEHRNVVNFFAGMDRVIGAEPGVWLALTSFSFDISVLELLWTLTRGFQVVIHPDNSTDTIPAEIQRHAVTHVQSTPSLARLFASDAQSLASLGSLKKLLLGGEALPASLVQTLRQTVRGQIINMYGPTETTVWSTTYPIKNASSIIPIGKPIANTQVYVFDSQLRPVPQGESGDLFIGGDGVVRGYWNRPELTAERFIPDPYRKGGRLYRTGDIARFLPDGNLEFLGRADFQ